MVAYVRSNTIKLKDLFASSTIQTDLKYTFKRESFDKVPLINVSSTVEVSYGERPIIELTLIDTYNVHLKFNETVAYAKFELNGSMINEMSVNDDEYDYELYPYLLKQGANILRIYITDHNQVEHIKVFNIEKEFVTPSAVVGDTLYIKNKRYTVAHVDNDTLTLTQPLHADIDESSFAEIPSFSVVPYAQLGFYGENVVTVPMSFVKSIFKDGMIEDMYELQSALGDILHTNIDIVRGHTSKTVSISNVETIIIPKGEE